MAKKGSVHDHNVTLYTKPKLQIIAVLYGAWRKAKSRDFLEHRRSPLNIGRQCNKRYEYAPSWACQHLKDLVKFGIVDTWNAWYGLTPRGVEYVTENKQIKEFLNIKTDKQKGKETHASR